MRRRKRSYRIEKGKKIIPMNQQTRDVIEAQFAAFRAKFGREPAPADPIFFDPEAETPRPISTVKYKRAWDQFLEVGARIGLDPALLYAARKTRRIVTGGNMQFLTDAELREWEEAVEEYHTKIASEDVVRS